MQQNQSLFPSFIGTSFRALDHLANACVNTAKAVENVSVILEQGSANLAEAANLAMQIQMHQLRLQLAEQKALAGA